MGVRYQPACSAARYTSRAAAPFGSTDAKPSPGRRPSARSPWVIWFTRASRSPARCSVPSASIAAIQSGLCRARPQNPSDATAQPPPGPGRNSERGADRLVTLVCELIVLPPAYGQRNPDDQQDDAEEQPDPRTDVLNQLDLQVRRVGCVHGARDAGRGCREAALEQDQPGRAGAVLQRERPVL